MVEDIRLNVFVFRPLLHLAEDINLYGNAAFAGLQLPDQKGHILTDIGIILKV